MAEIKVTITDETGNQSSVALPQYSKENNPTPQQATEKASVPTKEAKDSKQSNKALAAASMIGSQAISYCTSNVGKWTGNNSFQTAINFSSEVGSLAMMAAINPYMAAATVAVRLGTTAIDSFYDSYYENEKSKRAMARAGYNDVGQVVGRRH